MFTPVFCLSFILLVAAGQNQDSTEDILPVQSPRQPPLSTKTLHLAESGRLVRGTVYQRESTAYVLDLLTPNNDTCKYPQSSGSGSSYSSCCLAQWDDYTKYLTRTIPQADYTIQTACANGVTYLATKPSPTNELGPEETQIITRTNLANIKLQSIYRKKPDDKDWTLTTILGSAVWFPTSPNLPLPSGASHTKFDCELGVADCSPWLSRLSSFRTKATANPESVGYLSLLSFNFDTERADILCQHYKRTYWFPSGYTPPATLLRFSSEETQTLSSFSTRIEFVSLTSETAEPQTGRQSGLAASTSQFEQSSILPILYPTMPPNSNLSVGFNDSKIKITEPGNESTSSEDPFRFVDKCRVHGHKVTIYFFPVKRSRNVGFCEKELVLPDGQQRFAIDSIIPNNMTSIKDVSPGKAIVTIPITSWGHGTLLDTAGKILDQNTLSTNVNYDAFEKSIGVVTLTTTEMFENRVYLHFDKLDIWRPGTSIFNLDGISFYEDISSSTTNVFLELETQELSTWNLQTNLELIKTEAVPKPVDFADWDWPYDINSWGALCGKAETCRTIVQGEYNPIVRFPDRITKEYPELKGCLVQTWLFAATDPPRALTPAGSPGTTSTTLSAVWVPLYTDAQPQSLPNSPEPVNTGTPAGEAQEANDPQVNNPPQRTIDLGAGALVTAAPNLNGGGMIVNGMPLRNNGAITMADGRVVSLDGSGNIVYNGKTIQSAGIFGSPTNPTVGTRTNPKMGSGVGSRVSYGVSPGVRSGVSSGMSRNGGQDNSTSRSGGENENSSDATETEGVDPRSGQNGTRKKSDGTSLYEMWWTCVPLIILGTIAVL